MSKGGGLQEKDPGSLLTYWATHNYEELPCQPDTHAEASPQEASGSDSAVPAGRRLPCHAAISQTCAAPVNPVSRALRDLPHCLHSSGPSSPRYHARRSQLPGASYQIAAAEGRNRLPSRP